MVYRSAVFLVAKVGRMDAFISRLVRWQILQCFAEGPSTDLMGTVQKELPTGSMHIWYIC
jgi:hypothetical protein